MSERGSIWGNCLLTNQPATGLESTETTQNELALIQQQLDALTQQVTRLTDKLHETESVAKTRAGGGANKPAYARQIGINRFRALQAQSHSMA